MEDVRGRSGGLAYTFIGGGDGLSVIIQSFGDNIIFNKKVAKAE